MELMRIISLIILFALPLCLLPIAPLSAQHEELSAEHGSSNREDISDSPGVVPPAIAAYHGYNYADAYAEKSSSDHGGIKEDILGKYKPRYQKWKREFLSTEMGRREWASYEQNPRFTLTIDISDDNPKGASTGEYKWDAAGQLIGAHITLGAHLEEGFPNPIYYPVMNSLTLADSMYEINDDILAATKIAHEFGHVNRMAASIDSSLYRLQNELMPLYNKIFLSNGRNPSDPRLLELVRQIGGTPVEIWEDREYWGETNAMLYIRDRFDKNLRCSLFSRIKRSVDLYAKSYEERFLTIARSVPPSHKCGWE
jgi:YD repeat-containing protein